MSSMANDFRGRNENKVQANLRGAQVLINNGTNDQSTMAISNSYAANIWLILVDVGTAC